MLFRWLPFRIIYLLFLLFIQFRYFLSFTELIHPFFRFFLFLFEFRIIPWKILDFIFRLQGLSFTLLYLFMLLRDWWAYFRIWVGLDRGEIVRVVEYLYIFEGLHNLEIFFVLQIIDFAILGYIGQVALLIHIWVFFPNHIEQWWEIRNGLWLEFLKLSIFIFELNLLHRIQFILDIDTN